MASESESGYSDDDNDDDPAAQTVKFVEKFMDKVIFSVFIDLAEFESM